MIIPFLHMRLKGQYLPKVTQNVSTRVWTQALDSQPLYKKISKFHVQEWILASPTVVYKNLNVIFWKGKSLFIRFSVGSIDARKFGTTIYIMQTPSDYLGS